MFLKVCEADILIAAAVYDERDRLQQTEFFSIAAVLKRYYRYKQKTCLIRMKIVEDRPGVAGARAADDALFLERWKDTVLRYERLPISEPRRRPVRMPFKDNLLDHGMAHMSSAKWSASLLVQTPCRDTQSFLLGHASKVIIYQFEHVAFPLQNRDRPDEYRVTGVNKQTEFTLSDRAKPGPSCKSDAGVNMLRRAKQKRRRRGTGDHPTETAAGAAPSDEPNVDEYRHALGVDEDQLTGQIFDEVIALCADPEDNGDDERHTDSGQDSSGSGESDEQSSGCEETADDDPDPREYATRVGLVWGPYAHWVLLEQTRETLGKLRTPLNKFVMAQCDCHGYDRCKVAFSYSSPQQHRSALRKALRWLSKSRQLSAEAHSWLGENLKTQWAEQREP